MVVKEVRTRDDGEMIMKIDNKWPWYVCKYWKVV